MSNSFYLADSFSGLDGKIGIGGPLRARRFLIFEKKYFKIELFQRKSKVIAQEFYFRHRRKQ
jgi:hypothetical protein